MKPVEHEVSEPFAEARPSGDPVELEEPDSAFISLICPSISLKRVDGWAVVSNSQTAFCFQHAKRPPAATFARRRAGSRLWRDHVFCQLLVCFRVRRTGDGQKGDRASGGVRGLSYPAGAGLPATRAALSTFECEHMPLYSKPGQVQVTSPAS